MGEAETMQAARAQLPASGVERQRAGAGNAGATFDEMMPFTHFAETQGFEPADWE
ncbi:MAG: hypothetical protein RLY97_261, partial [Pseudomonadota bacterium]